MTTTSRTVPTTPAEFLAWENRQRQRYELVDGVARLMTGGTLGHNVLARRFVVALDRQLRPGCSAHQSDLKVTSPTGMVTYPDVLVRCGAFDEDATEVDDPVLIVEILSPSTRREDLIRKRYGYQAIPSLRLLLYVEPKKVQVEVVTREADNSWRSVFVTDPAASIRLEELGVSMALGDLYAGLTAASQRKEER